MMKWFVVIVFIFCKGVLYANNSVDANSSCEHALNLHNSTIFSGDNLPKNLTINRTVPLDTITKGSELIKEDIKTFAPTVLASFNQRRKVSRLLYNSGIFTSMFFGDILQKTLGAYADSIKKRDPKSRDSVNIPYNDLAKSIYSALEGHYISPRVSLTAAKEIIAEQGKYHFDLSTFSHIRQEFVSYSGDETVDKFNARGVVLINSMIDIGDEGMILTLKELTMHVLGSVFEFQESRKHDKAMVVNLKNKAEEINRSVKENFNSWEGDGWRGWMGLGLGVGAVVFGINVLETSLISFGEIAAGTYVAGFKLPKLDYYTVFLSEKVAKVGSSLRLGMQNQTIKNRIEHQLQDSTYEEKKSWLNWFEFGSDSNYNLVETLSTGSSEILTRLSSDISNLKMATNDLNLGIQKVRSGESTVVEIGKLEQVVDRTQEIMAVTLMTFQNDLDFGVLSQFPMAFKELSKARSQKNISALNPKLKSLLNQLNKEYLVVDELREQIKLILRSILSYDQILSVRKESLEVSDIIDSMEKSVRILESLQGKLMIAQQNMNYLKLNLSTIGDITNFANIKLLTTKLTNSYNELLSSLPEYQICLTGVTDQCLLPKHK